MKKKKIGLIAIVLIFITYLLEKILVKKDKAKNNQEFITKIYC